MSNMKEVCSEFVNNVLVKNVENRGFLAKLRKAKNTFEIYKYVTNYFTYNLEEVMSICSLFATYKNHTNEKTFGESLSFMKLQDSQEKRFEQWLKLDKTSAIYHLRHILAIAKKKNINYGDLLYSIIYWDHPNGFVQNNLAKDFWKSKKEDKK